MTTKLSWIDNKTGIECSACEMIARVRAAWVHDGKEESRDFCLDCAMAMGFVEVKLVEPASYAKYDSPVIEHDENQVKSIKEYLKLFRERRKLPTVSSTRRFICPPGRYCYGAPFEG